MIGLYSVHTFSQFNVTISASSDFTPKDVYIYTLSGSKDILVNKLEKRDNIWSFRYPNNYVGMMKAYFPDSNYSMNFISENKDINISIVGTGLKTKEIVYKDEANKLMDAYQDNQRKKETILPVLYQMKEFYKPSTAFYKAIDAEINLLSGNSNNNISGFPFIEYYTKNYKKYLVNSAGIPQPTQQDILSFISNSNEYLETSTLLRPILVAYLANANSGVKQDVAVDNLLKEVNIESPRGQMVLSELIEIFDAYEMTDLKNKYLSLAKNLKCTITDRLASTISVNDKTTLGATFENYNFHKPINSVAKSLYEMKSDKKVIVFWSSTCSHCETELPKLIPFYKQMKEKGIEIIGLSLDADKASYESKAKLYPWINDAELRGWYSGYAEKYNVHATPSYFVLDKDNKIVSKPDHVGDLIEYLGLK